MTLKYGMGAMYNRALTDHRSCVLITSKPYISISQNTTGLCFDVLVLMCVSEGLKWWVRKWFFSHQCWQQQQGSFLLMHWIECKFNPAKDLKKRSIFWTPLVLGTGTSFRRLKLPATKMHTISNTIFRHKFTCSFIWCDKFCLGCWL